MDFILLLNKIEWINGKGSGLSACVQTHTKIMTSFYLIIEVKIAEIIKFHNEINNVFYAIVLPFV